MIELPASMRMRLIDQIDENFAALGEEGTDEEFGQAVIDALEAVAEEQADDVGDEIVSHLEASAKLEGSLLQTMSEGFSSDPEIDYIGEKVVTALVHMCHIQWEEDAASDLFNRDEDDEGY